MGTCGKSFREVYETTVEEFLYLRKGKEEAYQRQMEMLRWHSYQEMALSPYIKSFDKPRSPMDYCRFPWEEELLEAEQTVVGLTKEEESHLYDLMRQFDERHGRDTS